jgi:hypothetical protein
MAINIAPVIKQSHHTYVYLLPDQYTNLNNTKSRFAWLWNLICSPKGITMIQGEESADENILT